MGVLKLGGVALVCSALWGCASLAPKAAVPAKTGAAAAANGGSNGAAASALPSKASLAPAAPGAAASAPVAITAAAVPGSPPAFASVIKDAKEQPGLFTLWRRDEKVWIELQPADLNRPLFLSPKLATGIGEAGLFGGLMASSPRVVEFRRVNNLVQLIAPNEAFTAKAGTPAARAVQSAFSASLVASAAVASQPHPERKSILVEANALFVADLLGISQRLDQAFRQGYGFDARNSSITRARSLPDALSIEVQGHYATARISQPTAGGPSSVPSTLPDPRSLFITVHYGLARLPAEPMHARAADPRVGYFQTVRSDFSDDLARSPRQRFVNRWRLEKKDPQAALSEPVKPITYWLDRSIPEKYRGAITAGILEWNKAFERIGFKNAVQVQVQPDDADFDTLDVNRASVRWMTNAQPSFGAIGPSHVDPRSGEILDADIAMESLSSRARRTERAQVLAAGASASDATPDAPAACNHADAATEQLGYAIDVLEARGELDASSAETEAYVLAYLKDVTMHEVGHTLGLRHNFRASRIYGEQQLNDATFTASHALTGSVMEYASVNLPAPGQAGGTPFQTTLGPYDYWAIEYGYKPLPAASEAVELARLAARSAEPELAYGTDEDNSLGIDPESLQFDLGNDAVAFARKRVAIARDLLERQESRRLAPGADYAVLRRSIGYALRDLGRAAQVLTRQIGGVRTLRDAPGSGRDPLQPVPAAQQRAALDVLSRSLLAADAIRLSPALQRRLAPDFAERTDAYFAGAGPLATDYSLGSVLIELQRSALQQLMSDGVSARLLDSEAKASSKADTLALSELYERLMRDLWSELGHGADIAAPRRELQREHVDRLSALLLRPGALSRADARSLLRAQSQALLARLEAANKRPGLSAETRAHLGASTEALSQALSARMVRTGS